MIDYNSDSAKYNREQRIKAQTETAGMQDLLFGRLQPQALQLEEAVLGALMLDREAFDTVHEIVGLRAESFYTEAHQAIYKAIEELSRGSKPIDILTVTEELRKMGAIETIGGSYHLVELTNRVGSAANIEYHARIILEKEVKRELIKSSTKTIHECYNDSTDVFDVLQSDALRREVIEDIPNRTVKIGSLSDAAEKLKRMVIKAQSGGILGNSYNLLSVDRIFNGTRKGRFDVFAARPAMGKSAYMLAACLNFAKQGIPVIIGSIELTQVELLGRLATAESGVENDKLEGKKTLTAEEFMLWEKALEYIKTLPIFINDFSTQTVRSLRFFIKKTIKILKLDPRYAKFFSDEEEQPIEVWVDYIQIMSSDDTSGKFEIREQQVAKQARGLKAIAKDFSLHVGALAQLNRSVETRGGNKKPILADLRESGAIEQEADSVSFIHRPEYYNITEDEDGGSTKNLMQIIVAKHRGGAIGEAKLYYERTNQRIFDWAEWEDLTPTPSVNTHQNVITGIRGELPAATPDLPF